MRKVFLAITAVIIFVMVVGFFNQTLTPIVPAASGSVWNLSVSGLVDHPLNLTLADIEAMPQTTVYGTIVCVDFPNETVAQGNWTGVRLWFLLEAAGVSANATKVAFFAIDGYSTDLTVETAMRGDVIVAYQRDGVSLGETLRLVVPGKWGYKWISLVTGIEAVDYDFKGFYEGRGYSDAADIPEGSLGYVGGPYPTPGPSPSPSPSPSPVAPEFPSVLPLLVPLILVVVLAVILRKRGLKGQTPQVLSVTL
jgi:DMSO/TMAO reductase YedYZ molybdopterin-dependent catalytic subunit